MLQPNRVYVMPDDRELAGRCEVLSIDAVERLCAFMRDHPRLFVLTGAGISRASGIPTYRDAAGKWVRSAPMTHQEFTASPDARRRYWARSMVGWRTMAMAQPNAAHVALARLEALGYVTHVVTQNVDGLHQRAGSERVLELHGSLHTVVCLGCGERYGREVVQATLEHANPTYVARAATPAPDGDANLDEGHDELVVPDCAGCGGVLKPDVVFYGANVPTTRVDAAHAALAAADAVLVVASSLAVYSGYRFCVRAQAEGKPVVAINLGRTRADPLLRFRLEVDCAEALAACAHALPALAVHRDA